MVAYLPFLMIITVMIFRESGLVKIVQEHNAMYVNRFALFFILLYLGISVFLNVRLSITKFDAAAHRAVTENYFAANSHEKRILAPMEFVFDELENYRGIQGLWLYSKLLANDSSYYGGGLLEHARTNSVDCIYLNGKFMRIFGLTGVKVDSVIAGYRVKGRGPDLLVFDRVQ